MLSTVSTHFARAHVDPRSFATSLYMPPGRKAGGLQVCWVAYIHMYIGLAKALATLQRCSLISLFLALNEIKNSAFLA